ncbi:MAG: hypothetical protein JXA25_10860 [Anaerolineales bacterium]|nr:hypothetical protein [Anaerolineales bacterium]
MAQKHSLNPVLLLTAIRKAVQNGLSAEDVLSFEERILYELQTVESMTRKRWKGIKELSFDQYQACIALQTLNTSYLKRFISPAAAPERSTRIPGILAFCNDLHEKIEAAALKYDPSTSDQELIDLSWPAYSTLREQNTVIRKTLKESTADPAVFSSQTFRAVQWLRFLEDQVEFLAHIKAVQAAARLFSITLRQNKRKKRLAEVPLHLRFFPGSALFRSKISKNTIILTLNEGFIHAPEHVLHAILRLAASTGDKADKQAMASYSSSGEYLRISTGLLQQTSPGNSELGLFHHLGQLADKIEREYFTFPTERPQIAWMKKPSYRTFGVYQASSNTIRISPALDHPDVPQFVVEYVLFHEFAHARVGVRVQKGRHQIHSKRFKGVEHQFARRDEAAAFLKDISRKYSIRGTS